eukprot:5485891-Pyramimonas_sp.AAC.1
MMWAPRGLKPSAGIVFSSLFFWFDGPEARQVSLEAGSSEQPPVVFFTTLGVSEEEDENVEGQTRTRYGEPRA